MLPSEIANPNITLLYLPGVEAKPQKNPYANHMGFMDYHWVH